MAREIFFRYNYHEIRTPILEETALFARGVGEETDIVSKEMYTFDDRDGTSLTLRPENTASVMRAYIEHRLDQRPGVQKLYYIGPMFRRERPQKGRYRQFYQIGAEAIGSESPAVDAEVIEMVVEMLRRGRDQRIPAADQFGGRSATAGRSFDRAAARGAERRGAARCAAIASGARETNPLRVLDCKVPEDQPIIEHCRPFSISSCGVPRRISPRCASILDDRGFVTKSGRAWCAASITTCAPRSRSCTGRWARRIRCSAADATTAWPKRSGRKCRAGHRIFDRRRPPGDEAEEGTDGTAALHSICLSRRWAMRPCGTARCWRGDMRRPDRSVEVGRKAS